MENLINRTYHYHKLIIAMNDNKQKQGNKDEKHEIMKDGDTKNNNDRASAEKPKPTRST